MCSYNYTQWVGFFKESFSHCTHLFLSPINKTCCPSYSELLIRLPTSNNSSEQQQQQQQQQQHIPLSASPNSSSSSTASSSTLQQQQQQQQLTTAAVTANDSFLARTISVSSTESDYINEGTIYMTCLLRNPLLKDCSQKISDLGMGWL